MLQHAWIPFTQLHRAATSDYGRAGRVDITQIPQQLDHGWLVTDPAADRHLFMPGTREFAYDQAPTLPGAARAHLEVVLPMRMLWSRALAQEAAPWHEAEKLQVFGPPKTRMVDDWATEYLYKYEFLNDGNPKPGGVIGRVLGPFRHPYPGDQLDSWARGNGPVADWAREVRDATDPEKSRTSRRAAGRSASQLQDAAAAAWNGFRTTLALWVDEAAPWIAGANPPTPARPSHRPITLT